MNQLVEHMFPVIRDTAQMIPTMKEVPSSCAFLTLTCSTFGVYNCMKVSR